MLRQFFGDDFLARVGAQARAMHSRWLTRALHHGGGKGVPRIPVRRVSDGGYAPVMATVEGREWAAQWWAEALESEALL